MAEKPHLNLVFIGHVDHGKSTLVGRLLLDTGHIEQHVIDKFRKEAEEKGKATFEFAWAMDHLKEERERGLTIDVAHRRFDTDKYYFTIIDAPGHRDFVKNMITGTSQADAAVLLVEAPAGVMAQTKEHVWLSKTLGVEQMIIAINKMDATKPPWDENRYNEVVEQISSLLKTVGYKTDEMLFVPVSAFTGDNSVEKSDNMPWWKGPTILGALDTITEPKKPTELPLRWPVQDVYTITGIGTVPVGRVETGVITPDIKIVFQPSDKVGEVKSIEMHHEQIPKAEPGDNVGINIRGIAKNDIRRGDVAGPVDNPPAVAKSFTAQIAVLNHPSVLTEGYTPVFHAHTAQVACTFEEIQKKLNPKDATVLEERSDEKPILLTTGDAAIVKVRPTKPMVIEKHSEFPQLGRFAVRDMGQTVAAGVVLDVEKR
jgi:elongation factor 1-alpha